MTRGRKPRAIEVSEAAGAYRRNPQRRPTNNIKAASELPTKPELVSSCPVASSVWDEVTDALKQANILSRTDTHLLTRYVLTYAEWTRLAAHIQKHGHSNEKGGSSAESVAFFKLSSEHGKLMSELGLSPSSRARLSVATSDPNDAKANSDLGAYLRAVKGA